MAEDTVSRRRFIGASAASVSAFAAVPSLPAATGRSRTNANERLRIGFIGMGGRCGAHLDSSIKDEWIEVGKIENTSLEHFRNFVAAAMAGVPSAVNCSPKLGAAAMVVVKLGVRSYREGKVFHFDPELRTVSEGDDSWANGLQQCRPSEPNPNTFPGGRPETEAASSIPNRTKKWKGHG